VFSARTQVPQMPNSLAERLSELRAAGIPVVDLTLSNPTDSGLFEDDSWIRHLAQPQSAIYRPEPFGLESARVAVACAYRKRGVSIDPGQIVLCASTSEAYSFLFKLLTDPGDVVLFPRPSYPLLEHLAAFEQVRLAHYAIRYDGSYYIDTDSVRRALGERSKAIVLVSPNNPTGSCTSLEELASLSECQVPLISDEVFADYPLQASQPFIPSVLLTQSNLVFSLGGLSKSAGLPQLKLAWIVVGGPVELRTQALSRLELICDTFLSLNTPVQVALPQLLDLGVQRQARIQQRLLRNHAELARLLESSPVSIRSGQGGWTVVLQLPNVSIDDWSLRLLTEAHVLVQPGWFYDDAQEGIVVVSLLTPENQLIEGISRLARAVSL
jgi:alanine-synthesizing transaminase